MTLKAPSGAQFRFIKQTNGSYVPEPGVTSRLTAVSGGWKLVANKTGHTLTFDSAGKLLTDKDARGRGLTMAYTLGKLTGITDHGSRTTTFSYGSTGAATGKITSVTTPAGKTTTYTYATNANSDVVLESATNGAGETTTYSYDTTTGTLDGIEDGNEDTSAQNTYDPLTGRITSQTDANDKTTTFAWRPVTGTGIPDGSGTSVMTDPDGGVTRDLYYGHVLIRHIDQRDNKTSYTYDSDLNLVAVEDALGQVTTMTYDSDGNMLTRTGPEPYESEDEPVEETWTYDTDDNLTSYTDGEANTTDYTYNGDRQAPHQHRPAQPHHHQHLRRQRPAHLDRDPRRPHRQLRLRRRREPRIGHQPRRPGHQLHLR